MTTPTAAAIYARISSDPEGAGKGVERQIEDCHKYANELGWPVHDEYTDRDISAFTGKHRPEYERMLGDIRDGTVDAVVVYNLDRLTRQMIEFEEFNAIVRKAGVTDVRFVTGGMDLGTDDGLLIGRIQAAVAADESAKKSRRIRRKLDQVAAEGRPHGGSVRPFGFDDDKITHRPDEVALIRQFLARFLAGESPRSLANWANQQPIRPTGGDQWHSHVVRNLLISDRSVGLRTHRGETVGTAIWKPVISIEERDKVLAILAAKKVSGRRVPQRYLLSGLLRCSKCDGCLFSGRRTTKRRYVCVSGPDHGGCGGTSIVAEPVERLIADAVLLRLDTPELSDALSGQNRSDADNGPLMGSISADREQLSELAALYANNEIVLREWTTARKIILDRLQAKERRLRRATKTTQLAAIVGHGEALATQWVTLNLGRQRAIIEAVFDHAVIGPGSPSAQSVDPGRIRPVWRL